MQRHHHLLAGCLLLAATAQRGWAFLAPPAGLAPSACRSHSGIRLPRPVVALKSAPGNEDPEANTPGVGGMPDLENVLGQPPMPLGGESTYEGYQSEYTDQQAEIEYFGDEELLQRYRDEMQVSNDEWQLNLFMKAQAGTWSGVWSEYTPVANGGPNGETAFRMTNIYKGRQECEGDYDGRVARWRDLVLRQAEDGGPLEPAVVGEATMLPGNFRGDQGSMAADNVFSRSQVAAREDGAAGERFEAEIWIRQGAYRTRVTFQYVAPSAEAAFDVERIVVKKERLGKQGPTAEEPELFGASGPGIYDPNARTPGAWDLSLHGGLSLCFPPSLPRGKKGSVIVDWIAGSVRYQADRLFLAPDGTLASLEVTSIGSADAMQFTIPEDQTSAAFKEEEDA